jgi:hypothetical protein
LSTLIEKGGIFCGWSYGDTLGRALDPTVLLRSMTGVTSFADADEHLLEVMLRTFTRDGLSYRELAPHRGKNHVRTQIQSRPLPSWDA